MVFDSLQLKHAIPSPAFPPVAMSCGKRLRWLMTFFMFALAAVQAARLPIETWGPKCEDFGAEKVEKKKWYHRERCHCQGDHSPSRGCGLESQESQKMTFLLAAADPKTCGCIDSAEKSAETSGRLCSVFDGAGDASGERLPHWDMFRRQRCYCFARGTYPSRGCGEFDEVRSRMHGKISSFRLAAADPATCRCFWPHGNWEKQLSRSAVVNASAVRFCSAVVEATAGGAPEQNIFLSKDTKTKFQNFVQEKLKLTPQLCEEVLTGTLKNFSTSPHSTRLFDEANGLSEHRDAKGFGHLDPLFTEMPSHKKYKDMLNHVCRDECKEIVNATVGNIFQMTEVDVRFGEKSFEETCADRVVRKVEAEILGCCGQACGWNEKSCMAWPFFTRDEKMDWLGECCTEFNILQNSTRELMCNSVLTPEQVKLVSKLDTKVKKGTDVGGSYTGQDPPLLWRKKGLKQFNGQLKKLKSKPKKGDQVNANFLENNPKIRGEGLENGWFREENNIENKRGATSLAQSDTTCTAAKLHHLDHCLKDVKIQVLNNCLREEAGWEVSDLPEEHDECNMRMIYEGKVEARATPDDCLDVEFGDVEIRRRFFLYDTSEPPKGQPVLEKPILCRFEAMEHEADCDDEFDRQSLNKDRFGGFAGYIHWIDEKKVEIRKKKKSEDAGRVKKAVADMKGFWSRPWIWKKTAWRRC